MQQSVITSVMTRTLLLTMSWISLNVWALETPFEPKYSTEIGTAHIQKELILTANQKKWLAEHPNIRLGFDPDFYPTEYRDSDGRYSGIAADIVKLLSQYLKLNINAVPDLSWSEVLTQIENKNLDILSAVGKSKSREGFLLYSQPYKESRMVVVTNKNKPVFGIQTKSIIDGQMVYSLAQLQGKTVAVTKDYATHHKLLEQNVPLSILTKPSTLESLEAVLSGEAYAAIVYLDLATAFLKANHMHELRIDDDAFKIAHMHFAVRKDWPELVGIINKTLDYIGPREITRIEKKWTSAPINLGIQNKEFSIYIGFLVLIIIAIGAWVVALAKVKRKLKALHERDTAQLVSQSRHVVMGEMIAMLTHQWKQPLTAMMLGIGAIKMKHSVMEMSDDDAEFLNTRIKKIETMMTTQDHLLSDFRDFFHPDKEKSLFNLNDSVNSVLEILHGLVVKHSVEINSDISKKLKVFGFDREMRHVMINLIKNAIDQMVSKSVKDPTIWISTFMNGDLLNITIEDNGGGIDESIIETIFEPYVSTKSLNGTGLGLYMTKRIIQDNFKGDINVANTKQGAEFTIIIKIT